MKDFLQELIENKSIVLPVLCAIAVAIVVFVISLKLRKKIDAKIKKRENQLVHSSNTVKAIRRESSSKMNIQGNPIYETGRRYYAHYDYEVDGKKYKYHCISFVYPTETITLAYRDDPKKAVWINDIPKPAWYKPAVLLLRLLPFISALLTVYLLGGVN